jgi:hypothetical protein
MYPHHRPRPEAVLVCNPTLVKESKCFAKHSPRHLLPKQMRTIRTRGRGTHNRGQQQLRQRQRRRRGTCSNYINIKKHIICLFFYISWCAVEGTQRHANPWNIDMIFMDFHVLQCGEDDPSGQQGVHHNAKPVASKSTQNVHEALILIL